MGIVGIFVGRDQHRSVADNFEDSKFEGELDLVQRGFLLARNTLRQLIV